MKRALCLLPLVLLGCSSGPVSLEGAKVVDVRVYAYATTAEGGEPADGKDLAKADQLPCLATELRLAIEVRAVPQGGTKPEVFSTGGGLADRVKTNPADYKDIEVGDAASYEAAHPLSLDDLELQGSEAVKIERTTPSSSGGEPRTEIAIVKIDKKKSSFSGYEISASPKAASDKKVTKLWAPDFSCEKRTVISAPSGDLNHRRGDNGPNVTVYVTKANTPFGELVLALVEHGGTSRYVIVDPSAPHTFASQGGTGVAGTSVEAGGDGGAGGTIQVLIDKRYPDLEAALKWEAPGGKGGRGAPDGKDGPPGQGSVKLSEDVMKVLAQRRDLPTGVTLIDPPKVSEPKPKKK